MMAKRRIAFGAAALSVAAMVAGGAPAVAQQPQEGQPAAGTWMYLRPGAALRETPNLTLSVVVRPTQWLPIQAVEPCTKFNCKVWYDLGDRRQLYARRSRVDLTGPPGTIIGADGKPVIGGTAGSGSPAVVQRSLRRGDAGPEVTVMQEALVRKGYPVKVDGKFGRGTEDAVKRFQRSQNLAADGVIGRLTRARLLA